MEQTARKSVCFASPDRLAGESLSPAKFQQPFGGGGKGLSRLTESKTDLFGAVSRIVVEARSRNDGDAYFFHKVFCERNVVGITEARNVGHDVVGATRFEACKAGLFQNLEHAVAADKVVVREFIVIALRQTQRHRPGLLQRSGGAHGPEVVDLADC